jgi:hypothetical protein
VAAGVGEREHRLKRLLVQRDREMDACKLWLAKNETVIRPEFVVFREVESRQVGRTDLQVERYPRPACRTQTYNVCRACYGDIVQIYRDNSVRKGVNFE